MRGGRRRVIRPAAAAALIACATVVVAGCAPAIDPSWTPPAWPATTLQVVDAEPRPLDAQAGQPLAATVSPERIRQDGVGIQARYALLPGVEAFNDAVRGYVRTARILSEEAGVPLDSQPPINAKQGLLFECVFSPPPSHADLDCNIPKMVVCLLGPFHSQEQQCRIPRCPRVHTGAYPRTSSSFFLSFSLPYTHL